VAFQHLEEFYGAAVLEFKDMLKLNEIELPQNLSAEWSEEQINAMAKVAWNLPHMWIHALGYDWEKKLTLSDIEELYRKL
jgi:3-deoxy-alpha-D-manno-octulosonate 8-oxidase